MGNLANTELGRRIIAGLEQVIADPTTKPAARRKAERDLAQWKSARAK